MKAFFISLVLAANALAQSVTMQTTAKLTDSGDNPPLMPVAADATEPAKPRVPALSVAVPNAQAPRLMTLVNPAIAIPYNSTIRQVQAFWNGTPLPLIDPTGTGLVEEAHSFGSMIPFFKPLFSPGGLPAGIGTTSRAGDTRRRSRVFSTRCRASPTSRRRSSKTKSTIRKTTSRCPRISSIATRRRPVSTSRHRRMRWKR